MISSMLMTCTLRFHLKEFPFSFSPKPSARESITGARDESSAYREEREDEFCINYTDESKDEFCLKIKKIIKLCTRFDL